ncbi:MAG: prophage MuSo1 DNA transposition protein [Nitrospirae bacterium]|nr:MAG: prophage MuSo1 DNA transposition protein [Nitrospirota bacterium]
MKKVFAKTSNVTNFVSAMNRLVNRQDGIPGMALIFGEPGLGKTRTTLWWAAQNENDGVFIRTKKLMTGRWLLEEVVAELGEAPMRRTSDLFRQAVDQLLDRPRTLFIDEADYLAHDARVLETLRDLHDTTNTPVVLIGMDKADQKLMRYKHLYDRFAVIVKFEPLVLSDIKAIADQMCDIKLSDDAVQHIHKQANRFRRVVVQLYKAEAIARTNSLKEVTAAHLQGVKK